MVRACRQSLTSSQDEMDAFTSVMLAVELERKKRAEHDALKTMEVNSADTRKPTAAAKSQCEHHERLRADPPKPKTLPPIPQTGFRMQQTRGDLGRTGDTDDRTARLITQHELDQEYLYRLWKSGRINDEYVQMWAKALTELQDESPCDYFVWLMQNQPMLV